MIELRLDNIYKRQPMPRGDVTIRIVSSIYETAQIYFCIHLGFVLFNLQMLKKISRLT